MKSSNLYMTTEQKISFILRHINVIERRMSIILAASFEDAPVSGIPKDRDTYLRIKGERAILVSFIKDAEEKINNAIAYIEATNE